MTLAFAPVANALVRVLARTRLAPPAVVLAHGLVGLVAALALGAGALVAAAVLLQVRTVLDNVDGRLARVTGRVTLTGRYLDTLVDFVVNAALFVALAATVGAPLLALAAFVALTLLLAVDYNVSQLFREARGDAPAPTGSTGGALERALALGYRLVFAPQDRLVRRLSDRRLERLLGDERDPVRTARATLAYHDRATVSVLANLGLSTQHLVLGACLALGAPRVYLWLLLASLALLPILQRRRERLAARALAA